MPRARQVGTGDNPRPAWNRATELVAFESRAIKPFVIRPQTHAHETEGCFAHGLAPLSQPGQTSVRPPITAVWMSTLPSYARYTDCLQMAQRDLLATLIPPLQVPAHGEGREQEDAEGVFGEEGH